ncbi:MAG: GNAT family N-acetyltransferase [Candidatus Methanomethylophilaceae archaeon]|nr:GNAT family N-acetyltransferase [Candidatus Methanomethylophilaceae archaeon]
MKIRDIEKVRELELSCIREYFSETLENRWEDLPQEWKDGLGASSRRHFSTYLESGLSFVAEEDGEILGFIFAQMLHHICDSDDLLWIENMGVHPYFRRNAIGYKLLRECVRAGREQGAQVAHSMIQPDNAPSILLHKKIGFFMDRRDVALLDLKDPKLKLRGAPPLSPLRACVRARLIYRTCKIGFHRVPFDGQ